MLLVRGSSCIVEEAVKSPTPIYLSNSSFNPELAMLLTV